MKKVIFAIFAHPDDEAFGPSGTLLSEVRSGNDVHLITLTLGQAGMNMDALPNLGSIREQEWRNAGKLIGATSMTALNYIDGQLNNTDMLSISKQLSDLIMNTVQHEPSDTIIELISNDTNGITGHIDHIVAARSACLVFYKLKAIDARIRRLRLACLPYSRMAAINTDWLYMEAGRQDTEIDEVIDARHHRDAIIDIIRCHYTQRTDGENHISQRGESLGLEYFIVKQ